MAHSNMVPATTTLPNAMYMLNKGNLVLLLLVGSAGAALHGASFAGNLTASTASLVRYDSSGSGSWARVLDFGVLPFPALSGMLAADAAGSKFWLAAGESEQAGQDTLFYAAPGGANVSALTTASPMTTLAYAADADEFLGTWQRPGAGEHLFFGALDPYRARQNTMADLTANDSVPWATFGASALDPRSLAFHFVVGVESTAGQAFSLARVAPNGHGIDVELGKPCAAGCTLQSVARVEGVAGPVALTMTPGVLNRSAGALYTYAWVEWDVAAGAPAAGAKPIGAWQHPRYNTFSATAAGGGALWASDAFSGSSSSVVRVEAASGAVTKLPLTGLGGGALFDLVYVEDRQ